MNIIQKIFRFYSVKTEETKFSWNWYTMWFHEFFGLQYFLKKMLHTVSFMNIQCNNKNIMRFFFSCFITWLGHFIHGRFCLELSWPSYKIANQIIENWTWFSNQYFKRSVLRGNEYSCRVRFFLLIFKKTQQENFVKSILWNNFWHLFIFFFSPVPCFYIISYWVNLLP